MKVIESQGTTAYLVATSVATTTAAEIKTAIAAGKQINCLLDLGDISLGSRSATEYTCMSSDAAFKSLGAISLSNITPQLLFDPADTVGQDDLRDMWDNSTRRKLIILLNDQITPTTGNKTSITFEAAISTPTMGIAKDNAVQYSPTIEICTKPDLIMAT